MKHLFVLFIYYRSAATVLTVMKKYELGGVRPEDTDDMGKVPKNGGRVQQPPTNEARPKPVWVFTWNNTTH